MKHPGLIIGILIVFALGIAFLFRERPPAFADLKEACDTTLRATPRLEALQALLAARKIPYKQKQAPLDEMFKEILVSNQIGRPDVERSSRCLYFENIPIRGGFPGYSLAFGYFVFSEDGALISYYIHSASFFM